MSDSRVLCWGGREDRKNGVRLLFLSLLFFKIFWINISLFKHYYVIDAGCLVMN